MDILTNIMVISLGTITAIMIILTYVEEPGLQKKTFSTLALTPIPISMLLIIFIINSMKDIRPETSISIDHLGILISSLMIYILMSLTLMSRTAVRKKGFYNLNIISENGLMTGLLGGLTFSLAIVSITMLVTESAQNIIWASILSLTFGWIVFGFFFGLRGEFEKTG